ncbi:MAG: barstar family protein [Saccharospirillaceae bacterium]|nr:barstar family protein [Saccharospirillaceae bacterium]
MEILVNWMDVKSEDHFYELFLPQLNAPDWHGDNLNALNDSLVTGDIMGSAPPWFFHNINISKVLPELLEFQSKVLQIFNDSIAEGNGSKVINE